ncbi:unnamed protein product [Anisakis simplex]|uniref:tRNA-dihydrouridine(47) synthase [NAD(P)(+)] n=1 Tax=Anisakis simplex TaxID=6269 RepID=A0A0M3IXY8_ANISI|nr:unnamed protein product [Anisakis simplex]
MPTACGIMNENQYPIANNAVMDGDDNESDDRLVNTVSEKIGQLQSQKPISSDGYARIKEEYLVDLHRNAPSNGLKKTTRDESGKKIKLRGVNRERGRQMTKARAEMRKQNVKLCPSLISNKECKFGDKCKSLHSLDEYLSVKPPDLGDSCYIFDQRGHCPFSYACRFADAHTAEDLSQKRKEAADGYSETLNVNSMQIQKALRKKEYDFTKSQNVIISFNICISVQFMNISSNNIYPKALQLDESEQLIGCVEREKPKLDMRTLSGKPYLSPLTTLGNLPFRRLCVDLGVEITCSEMCLCTSLLSGTASEWSLLKRHPSEKIFGVQLAGGFADTMCRASQIISENMECGKTSMADAHIFKVDFIDINCGCPIDMINNKGAGCALASKASKLNGMVKSMRAVMSDLPISVKLRTGLRENVYTAHKTIAQLVSGSVPDLVTLHPRSKEQRYTKLADWEYTRDCSEAAGEVPFWVCGDVLSHHDYYNARLRLKNYPVDGVMIGRGALIKPWIFTEIKERRDWDISATERLEFIQRFVNYGLDHWGSDDEGVEKTRNFLLEWLSFAYRYIPVALLEVIPQRINERPPAFRGRNDLETLLASDLSQDWIKISEMFLGKVKDGFLFMPKHNANAYGSEYACTHPVE